MNQRKLIQSAIDVSNGSASLRVLKFLVTVSLAWVPFSTNAQFREIGNHEQSTYFVSNEPPVRLGSGILFWIGTHIAFSDHSGHRLDVERHFMSCNSAQVSSGSITWELEIEDAKALTKREIARKLQSIFEKSKGERNFQATSAIELIDIRESLSEAIRNARVGLKELCNKATQEERNGAIPIAASNPDKDGKFNLYSIVSGTFKLKGKYLEGWIRKHYVVEKNYLKEDGTEYRDSKGQPMKVSRYSDVGHTLSAWRIDCGERESVIFSLTEYDRFGQVAKSWDDPQVKLLPNIPGSISEKITQTVCKIYR